MRIEGHPGGHRGRNAGCDKQSIVKTTMSPRQEFRRVLPQIDCHPASTPPPFAPVTDRAERVGKRWAYLDAKPHEPRTCILALHPSMQMSDLLQHQASKERI